MATQQLTATDIQKFEKVLSAQQFTATLSTRTLEALSSIATPDEIDTLQAVLDLMSRGRGKPWQVEYIVEIIRRLAEKHESTT